MRSHRFALGLGLILSTVLLSVAGATEHTFSVEGDRCYLNGEEIKIIGLRCSNALISEQETQELIEALPVFHSYGVNTVNVFFMGSRFGDVKGYRPDGTLDPVYAGRMGRIIEAADREGMIVLVGCFYWGGSRAKDELGGWNQGEANTAVANAVRWLSENDYRNVFVDPDNEGMASRATGWEIGEMIDAAHAVDPSIVMGYNNKPEPPKNADILLHFSPQAEGKPWVQSEGTPNNAPGGYWGSYSKQGERYGNGPDLYNYINIGLYTQEMKEDQFRQTDRDIREHNGHMLASTWLQCVPPHGPNASPGGEGTADDPGVKWWLEYVKEHYAEESKDESNQP